MLYHRRRGVVADIADGNIAVTRGRKIHVVGAGRREADEAQRGQGFKSCTVQPDLVDQQYLAAGSPRIDLRACAGSVKRDVGQCGHQGRCVDIGRTQ